MEKVICAALFPHGHLPGHCRVTSSRISAVNPDWVLVDVGLYNDQGQPASDEDEAIVNLSTHQAIGPTNIGFCGEDAGAQEPVRGYSSVPLDVLASLGMSRCQGQAAAAPTPPGTPNGSAEFAAFAGEWGAHETSLVIDARGVGTMKYADLTRCPSCSNADAPLGTLTFALRSASKGTGAGRVTATSDSKNSAIGDPVELLIVPGSPGQLLNVTIAGRQLLSFCNATSIGQCGA